VTRELKFTSVSVAGRAPVEFCVDVAAGDPVGDWLVAHDEIDEPVMRAFLDLVAPGDHVLDLGCHLGTFSLPAAAVGAEVLAVDASPRHVEQLTAAAERNGFERIHVVHAALSDGAQPVDFIEQSIHGRVQSGHLAGAGPPTTPTIRVATVTADELLATHGWDDVDVIKMDIEGAEQMALRGMRRLFAGGARPAIVFECNGGTLPLLGGSICELRSVIAALGYELLMIDHLRPGTLVETAPDSVQPEAACDYLAVTARSPELQERWRIEPPFTAAQTVSRLLDLAASEAAGYRTYATDLLRFGPPWLRGDPAVGPALRALEHDLDPAVRAAVGAAAAPSRAADHANSATPRDEGVPEDLVVTATRLAVRVETQRSDWRRDADETGVVAHVLDDVSFHLRAGQLLGVIGDPVAAAALLAAVAGARKPAAGALETRGRPLLVSQIGDVLEPGLSVSENILLLAAFLGAHVPQVSGRVAEIADAAGAASELGTPLYDTRGDTAARLALAVAYGCVADGPLLLDNVRMVKDEHFRRWLEIRTRQLRGRGVAIMQAVPDPREFVAPVDRLLWLDGGCVRACGHGPSVLDASRRAQGLHAGDTALPPRRPGAVPMTA